MKKKYRYRKQLSQALFSLGYKDESSFKKVSDQITKRETNQYVNPFRRMLKASLTLRFDEQRALLERLGSTIKEREAKRAEDNALLENS